MRYKIFISSVQSEFAGERRMLADYLRTDVLFAKFFDTFIFEDTPAKDHSPEPAFFVRDGFVTVIYRKQDVAYNKVNDKGGQTGGQILSETQIKIITLMEKNPKISRKELSSMLKVNTSAIQKHIDKLKQSGIIKREGADFGGYWKIKNN